MRLAASSAVPLRPVPPVRNGEPGTALSAPLAATENAETLFGMRSLLVYTKVPCAIKQAVQSTIRRIDLMIVAPCFQFILEEGAVQVMRRRCSYLLTVVAMYEYRTLEGAVDSSRGRPTLCR